MRAIDAAGNAYNASMNIARLLRIAVKAAAKVYVVADSSKIGRTALTRFGNVRDWAGLITDDEVDPTIAEQLRAAGVSMIVAPREAIEVR